MKLACNVGGEPSAVPFFLHSKDAGKHFRKSLSFYRYVAAYHKQGPPQLVHITIDLHKRLFDTPSPASLAHAIDASSPDVGSEHWAEPMPPALDRLVADNDAAFGQKFLHISERKWEPNVEHYHVVDDPGVRFEVTEGTAFRYPKMLASELPCLKTRCFESALAQKAPSAARFVSR